MKNTLTNSKNSKTISLQSLKRHSASSFIWEVMEAKDQGEPLPDELKLNFQVNYGKDMIFQDTPFCTNFSFKDFKVSIFGEVTQSLSTIFQLKSHLCCPCFSRPNICWSAVLIQPKVVNYAKLPVSVHCPLQLNRSTIVLTHPWCMR